MKEVKCPKCDSKFEMDATGYADIVNQVRGDEFESELNSRLKDLEANHNMKLELAEQSIASETPSPFPLRKQPDKETVNIKTTRKSATFLFMILLSNRSYM